MAKRSDFAQKLLDDLRQRKERLASSSQSSNRSNSSLAIIDAYSYAKQNYRGSKDTRRNDLIGSRTKSNNSGRSSYAYGGSDSAQHIVPYNNGRAQSSHQMGDLSMALALALQTGANAGRRGAKAGPFPAFSPSQIDDISKGVIRLNQILRACSDGGVNLDRYSVQIGKELLKGAVDLEKSLKMLVNLQEASQYPAAKPERKNRIKLLDEGEEEDEESGVNVAQEWKLDRPRFSFDGASKQVSDSRSASFRSNGQEKARIPNVIARLMGLEKLPENENSSNVPKNTASKGGAGGTFRKAKQETGKVFGQKAKGRDDNVSPPKRQRVGVEANPFVVNTSFVVSRDRNLPPSFGFEVVFDGQKTTKSSEKAFPAKKERGQEDIKKNSPQATREKQQSAKPARKARESEAISKNTLSKSNRQTNLSQEKKKSGKRSTNLVQTKLPINGKQEDEVFRERISMESNAFKEVKTSISDQSFSSRRSELEPRRQRARNVQAMDEKAVNAQILQRVKAPKGNNKNALPRKMDEVAARKSVRHQSSDLKEAKKPKRLENLSIHGKAMIKINGSEGKDRTVDLEQKEVIKEVEKAFSLYTWKEDVRTRIKEQPKELSLLCQDVILHDQLNEATFCEDQVLDCLTGVANELDVDAKQGHGSEITITDMEVKPSSRPKNTTHETIEVQTKPISQEPELTESENGLKKILIKSQLFLNTAEALFNLEIPINVLHSSGQNDTTADQNDDRRLVLDCGYELMRRKGRRQEMSVHPIYAGRATIIGLVKVSTFDGLVRELSRDLERLKMYGRDRLDGYGGPGEYLAAMQERDVYGREPYGDCMWDRGWGEGVFAYVEVDEVVRDVEKFVLNALLDEVTGDLFLHLGLGFS